MRLSHLTALTCLTIQARLPIDCCLPSSLVRLHAKGLMNLSRLRPLKILQVRDWAWLATAVGLAGT